MRSMRAVWLALAALAIGSADLEAQSVTYNFVSYEHFQNGYTLSGAITTDGTLGPIQGTNVTAWTWTITNGVHTDTQSGTHLEPTTTGLSATSTELSVDLTVGQVVFQGPANTYLEYATHLNSYNAAILGGVRAWASTSLSAGDRMVIALSCPLAGLTPLDFRSARFEEEANPRNCRGFVDIANLKAGMQSALDCVRDVTGLGSALPLTSAYRTPGYQAHLLEVWNLSQDLARGRIPLECSALRTKVLEEKAKHCLVSRPASPNGPHTRGLAFDVGMPLPLYSESLLDGYAATCGVRRCNPFGDKVHFQSLSVRSCHVVGE